MAPEMAAAYVAGLIPSALVTGAHLLLFRKKITSAPMQQLQKNLATVGMYWSESGACIRTLAEGTPDSDSAIYLKGLKILGLGCFFLSWIGVFFHLLILCSLRYLAVPRIERAILNSALIRRPLGSAEVMDVLAEIQARVLNAKIPGFGS